MREIGLTKARSMGPVAAAVAQSGGSVSRVFRKADVPLAANDQPDLLIPLRDQLRVVEYAAQEIGDPALPVRLSIEGGVAHLGAFGRHVSSAPSLHTAIVRCNQFIGVMLQTATRMSVVRCGTEVRWTYGLTDSITVGRQTNELLAIGYMVDLVRHFLGRRWTPTFVELSAMQGAGQAAAQPLMGCEIRRGDGAAAVILPSRCLQAINRTPAAPVDPDSLGALPGPSEFVSAVEQLVLLGLVERQRAEEGVCRRLRVSKRSLQRLLAAHGTSFERVLRHVLFARATALLKSSSLSITEIAFELGYSDSAHFTRAFAKWAGEPPTRWRLRQGLAPPAFAD